LVSAYGVTIMSLSDPLSNDDRYSRTRLRDRAVTITRKHKTNVAVLLTMTATRNRMARLGGKPEFKVCNRPPLSEQEIYAVRRHKVYTFHRPVPCFVNLPHPGDRAECVTIV
jgi:hypothetical protein